MKLPGVSQSAFAPPQSTYPARLTGGDAVLIIVRRGQQRASLILDGLLQELGKRWMGMVILRILYQLPTCPPAPRSGRRALLRGGHMPPGGDSGNLQGTHPPILHAHS
uniref:Uncharacterized protein n=1 Tax=Mus spicilegus TaxID=10103 RepID=A0A8C6HE14_MUSSI